MIRNENEVTGESNASRDNNISVFRSTLSNGGFRFEDQDGNVLRKCATKPYTHMSVQAWPSSPDKPFLCFHSTPNPKKVHSLAKMLRVVAISEKGGAQ